MTQHEIGMIVGAAVLFFSFMCSAAIIAAAMRSGQISKKERDRDAYRIYKADQRDR